MHQPMMSPAPIGTTPPGAAGSTTTTRSSRPGLFRRLTEPVRCGGPTGPGRAAGLLIPGIVRVDEHSRVRLGSLRPAGHKDDNVGRLAGHGRRTRSIHSSRPLTLSSPALLESLADRPSVLLFCHPLPGIRFAIERIHHGGPAALVAGVNIAYWTVLARLHDIGGAHHSAPCSRAPPPPRAPLPFSRPLPLLAPSDLRSPGRGGRSPST
jgi:hypothetical protein